MLVRTGLLPQLLGPARQDGRRIRLGHGEGNEDPHNKRHDELDPVEPAPARRVGEVATYQGADGGTDEGRGREGSHGNTSLLVTPQVSKSAAHEGHGRGESDTINGTADDQGREVFGNRLGDDENYRDEKRRTVDDFSAIDFGEGREHQRTHAETNDEDGNSQEGNFLTDVEGLFDALEVGSDDGRSESDDEAGDGHNHGAVPLVQLAPILGVFWVIRHKGDEFVLLFRAFGGIYHHGALDVTLGLLCKVLGQVGILRECPVW